MPEPNVSVEPQPAGPVPAPAQPAQPVVNPAPAPAPQRSVDDSQQRGLIADLQKERQARQRLEQQIATHQAELATERRRIQALAGVNPQSDQEVELDQIRARIVELFPVLAKLDENQLEGLLGLSEQASGIQEATQHHWTSHGRAMLDALEDSVSEAIGGQLNARQTRALARAYVAEAETNPDFLKRHEAGDLDLIDEFTKAWIEDWFEPARRRVVTQEVGRQRPVPNGRDRNVQTTPPKKIDYKDPKAVEDAMVESYRSHGGRFET